MLKAAAESTRKATRRVALINGGAMRIYATCLYLAQIALTTPLAFEQPGRPLLDVDLPHLLAVERRQHQSDARNFPGDRDGFSDPGVAVLLDGDADLTPPQLRLNHEKAAAVTAADPHRSSALVGLDASREPSAGASADGEAGAEGVVGGLNGHIVKGLSVPTIELKMTAEGKGSQNRTFTLKSYVDRKAMQHQRVMFIKSKVKDLLKHNSSSSRSMQPVTSASNRAADAPTTATQPSPCCTLSALETPSEVNQSTSAGTQAGGVPAELSSANRGHRHASPFTVERLAIAAPCIQDNAAGAADDWSAHINVPVSSTSHSSQRVLTANLYLHFRGRPLENKTTSLYGEKLTVLLQQTTPCGRFPMTAGVRKMSRIVGHIRVPWSYVGFVKFNLNRVLNSCVESGGKNRWLVMSAINSTGHAVQTKELFGAGDCSNSEGLTLGQENEWSRLPDVALQTTASSVASGPHEEPAKLPKLEPGDYTSSERASPKSYVEMVLLKRPA